MDKASLTSLIEQYRSGLEAEMTILQRIQHASERQHEAAAAHDLEALHKAADDRDALMAALVSIESELRDVRVTISKNRKDARPLPGYTEAAELHTRAMALAAKILKTDEDSKEALAKAEQARRDQARAVEQGETTLSAYRRVMSVPPGATLVDRRG
jgi:hypothetical protein